MIPLFRDAYPDIKFLTQEEPEFRREVQPPASLNGLDVPSRRAVFVPWKPSRRRGFGMGTRLSVEEPMLSTRLHLTSESTDSQDRALLRDLRAWTSSPMTRPMSFSPATSGMSGCTGRRATFSAPTRRQSPATRHPERRRASDGGALCPRPRARPRPNTGTTRMAGARASSF